MAVARLTWKAKHALAKFIAVNGEANYNAYCAFAEQHGFRQFTRGYLRNWCQRNRPLIREYRAKFEEEVRAVTSLTKKARVEKLERMVTVLDEEIENCEDTDKLLKLVEQQRKLLQAIAQEQGEWNKTELEMPQQMPVSVMGALAAAAKNAGLLEAPTEAVDGEFTEIGDPTD